MFALVGPRGLGMIVPLRKFWFMSFFALSCELLKQLLDDLILLSL